MSENRSYIDIAVGLTPDARAAIEQAAQRHGLALE